MDAVVTGVEEFGLFAQGIELPAEGLIHVSSLADDFYRYEKASHRLTGHRSGNSFRLGDMIRVAVARVDVERRELDFRLVARNASPGPKRRPTSEARVPPPLQKKHSPTQRKVNALSRSFRRNGSAQSARPIRRSKSNRRLQPMLTL